MAQTTKTTKKEIRRELIKNTLDLLDMCKEMETSLNRFKNRYVDNLLIMTDHELVELSHILKRRENKQWVF